MTTMAAMAVAARMTTVAGMAATAAAAGAGATTVVVAAAPPPVASALSVVTWPSRSGNGERIAHEVGTPAAERSRSAQVCDGEGPRGAAAGR